MAERVGFIGLGIMGMPMARNLMEAGYELTVHNRSPEKAEELGKEGAAVAATPREVAENSDVVITMLPDSPQVREVVAGEEGVLEGISEGALLIDMSTISPVVTEELAEALQEKGASMLDAPVSGGDVGAIEGTLSIMVGGEQADFQRAKPLFEALVLGSAGGVSAQKILEVLSGGLASNKVMEVKREKFLSHSFEPGFRSELHHKDLGIALAAGREYGVVLPATAVADQLFEALITRGRGGWDHSALLTLVEDLAQREI